MAQQTGLGGQRQALLTLVQMRQQDLEPRRELITDLHRYAHARIPHQPALTPKTTHYFFTASLPARHARPRRTGPAAAGVGAIRGIFTATSAAEARERLGQVAEQLRPHAPKVARLLEDAEADLLAFYGFPWLLCQAAAA